MRLTVKLAAFSMLGMASALATPAQAANGSVWDHNGSRMTFEENGEKRKLVYAEPKEGLDKAGIKKGTVLFNGERKADGRLAGFAKIFKGNCNSIDYFVEGTLNEQNGEIVLQGQAPVYASGTACEVNGYSDSSPASTLKFTRLGDAPESAVVAESAPGEDIEQGDGGQNNDYLPPSMRGGNSGNRDTARTGAAPSPQRDATPAPRRETAPAPQREATPRRDQAPRAQARNDPRDIDESDPDDRGSYYARQRRYGRYPADDYDRRYSRAPAPYQERGYRRRPGIWEPEDEMEDDVEYEEEYERPVSPFWRRRAY